MATSENIEELISANILDFLVDFVCYAINCDDSDDSDLSEDDWSKMSKIITNQELKDIKTYNLVIDALEPIKPTFTCNTASCGPKELVASFHQFTQQIIADLKGEYTEKECILIDTMARVLFDLAIFAKRAQMNLTKEDLKLIGPRIYCTIRKLQNFKQGEIFPKYSDTYQDKLSTWIKESPPDTRSVLLIHYYEDTTYVSLPIGIKYKFKKTNEEQPDQFYIHFRVYRL